MLVQPAPQTSVPPPAFPPATPFIFVILFTLVPATHGVDGILPLYCAHAQPAPPATSIFKDHCHSTAPALQPLAPLPELPAFPFLFIVPVPVMVVLINTLYQAVSNVCPAGIAKLS